MYPNAIFFFTLILPNSLAAYDILRISRSQNSRSTFEPLIVAGSSGRKQRPSAVGKKRTRRELSHPLKTNLPIFAAASLSVVWWSSSTANHSYVVVRCGTCRLGTKRGGKISEWIPNLNVVWRLSPLCILGGFFYHDLTSSETSVYQNPS